VGLPGRTLDDDIETLRFNAKCEIDYPLAMILQPYPGTDIDRYARENGYFDGDYSAINYNYYLRSPLTFRSEGEKRQIENLHKLFAVTVEVPWLLPIVRRLVRLPSNLIFTSIFRWWYSYCYHWRIMRYRLRFSDVMENLKVLFGIYSKESFDANCEENRRRDGGVLRGDDVDRVGDIPDGLAPQTVEEACAGAAR
jgi:anaerobic magnesium-protoporphyrin IX monomethyl ester cyclase